jgi:hypothetical protein
MQDFQGSGFRVSGERRSAGERGGNNFSGNKILNTENGSSQGQNLALTGLFVPALLYSEMPALEMFWNLFS